MVICHNTAIDNTQTTPKLPFSYNTRTKKCSGIPEGLISASRPRSVFLGTQIEAVGLRSPNHEQKTEEIYNCHVNANTYQ